MSSYFVLTLHSVSESLEDQLTELVFSYDAQGVAEDLVFSQSLEHYQPVVVSQNLKSLKAFFESAPSEELLSSLDALGISWRISEEGQKDWLAEWKKGFKSLPLTEDFWIVPRWEDPPLEALHFYHIEPGMAFGTGTHETTQLVLEAMAGWKPTSSKSSFLDVGTGSGILAFYASIKGFERILALDNDSEAVRVAGENLAYNGGNSIEVSAKDLGDLQETFDIVVANIIQSVLIRLRTGLTRAVRPGGKLIVSGILREHEDSFLTDFFAPGDFVVTERRHKGDWVCIAAQRK